MDFRDVAQEFLQRSDVPSLRIVAQLALGQLTFTQYYDHLLQTARLNGLAVDVGRTCNLRCPGMCYRSERGMRTDPRAYAPREAFYRVLREGAQTGLQNLTVNGTEPLLPGEARDRTFDLLTHAGQRESRPYLTGMVTNGLLVGSCWPQLDRAVAEGQLDYVDLSLDSGRAEEHDRIRGVSGAFAKTVTALRDLNGRYRDSLRVGVSTVLRPDNQAGVLDLLRTTAAFNRFFFMTPVIPPPGVGAVKCMTSEEVITFARSLESLLTQELADAGIEVTLQLTGLQAYRFVEAGLLNWFDLKEPAGRLFAEKQLGANQLLYALAILPQYGSNIGQLLYTGDYLPHAHFLSADNPRQYAVGNIRDTSISELHRRGLEGQVFRDLLQARDQHACRNRNCWASCFGGLAVHAEMAYLHGIALTEQPSECSEPGSIPTEPKRRLPLI